MNKTQRPWTDWLPITRQEMDQRGWDAADVIIVSGDAYVDHPAFGTAVIGRLLEKQGLRVVILAQPNWRDDLRDFRKLGAPRIFFGVTSGCMDSMVNHYTANKRLRSTDAYTPGGQAGFRPDYAATVYSKILKMLYPETPVIIGGIEASLRRVTHYDYWSDALKPGILSESGADILLYGMGELPLLEVLRLLQKGVPIHAITTVHQTAVLLPEEEKPPVNHNWQDFELASHEACLKDKKTYASNFKHIEQESNRQHARRLIQKTGNRTLVINPPFPLMSESDIDASFDLPYTRMPHPKYEKRGRIPAYDMIRHSINLHRGCFGGCAFCTISAHQGKFIVSRSKESILREVDAVTKMPDFRGYISDLGGPSANMYKMKGKDPAICERCVSPSCIHPMICHNLDTSHKPLLEIYREASAHPDVQKAFVTSGIRYDLFLRPGEKDGTNNDDGGHASYLEELVTHHVSGRLKVAPEHTSEQVLKLMRKPSFTYFHAFRKKFEEISQKRGLKQFIVPYFISSHPGCGLDDMAELAAETRDLGFKLEQVQDFTPTPMTLATEIYYSGYHPYTLKPVFTPRSKQEKLDQNRFFFWYKPENGAWIRHILEKMGRMDLIEKLLGSGWSKAVQKKVKKRSYKD